MTFTLGFSEDEDIARTTDILLDTFNGDHQYVTAVYPDHFSPAGRELAAKRFLALKRADPTTKWLKVTDEESGKIVGIAMWNVWTEEKPLEGARGGSLSGDYWKTPDDKEYAEYLLNGYLAPRKKWIEEEELPLLSLEFLAVDPLYQYRGAGKMLTEWGTKLADELGAAACVESSVYGRHLYEALGFEYQHHHQVITPKGKWEGRKIQRVYWMTRPRKDQKSLSSNGSNGH